MGNESLADLDTVADSASYSGTFLLENPTVYRSKRTSTAIASSKDRIPEPVDISRQDVSRVQNIPKNVVNDNEDLSDEFMVNYKGRSYNIKRLFKKHPGGSKILKAYKGLSLDEAMVTNPHSVAAFHLFEEFLRAHQEAYQEIEKLVDWSAPLLPQVGSLGDRYWEWVNLPVDRPIRLFASDVMEGLTVTPWYMIPIIWIPISLFFIYRGCMLDLTGTVVDSMPKIIFALCWGFLLWTLLEYTLHRKLFHMKPSPHSKTLITLHFLMHGLHHKAPFDGQRLVFPPIPAVFLAVVIYKIYRMVFPMVLSNFVIAGVMIGYLCYDMTHYYLHYGAPKAQTYMYTMKRYHNYHHFSHHDEGFGISSRLWDYVFGTIIRLRNLKKAIEW